MSNDNWDKGKQADDDDPKDFANEFSSVEKVLSVIKPMEDVERLRASDRAKQSLACCGRVRQRGNRVHG